MRSPALAIAFVLQACQEPAPPAAPADLDGPVAQANRTDGVSGASSTGAGTGTQGEPWSHLVDRVGTSINDSTVAALRGALVGRSRDRTYEQQQIEAALLQLEYQLVNDCSRPVSEPSFSAYQTAEADSLQHDRDLLLTLLSQVGPEGRKKILGEADGLSSLARPRQNTVNQSMLPLPLWMATSPDDTERVALQRTFVSLNFTAEASASQSKAAFSAFSNGLHSLDPAGEMTPQQVVDAMAVLDQHLLGDQSRRFDAILGVCGSMKVELWVNLLVGEWVSGYLGNLGGLSGLGESASRRHAKTQSLSGGQGGGQGGGMQGGGMQGGGMQGGGGQGGGQGGGMQGGGQGGGMQGGGQGGGGQSDQTGAMGFSAGGQSGQGGSTQVGAGQGFSAGGFSSGGGQGGGSKEVGPPVGNLPSRGGSK